MTQRRVPLVNLRDYTHGTQQERDRFVKVFGEGLREFGFVSVEGHGVDQNLIRRTYADVAAFFNLPGEVKQKYEIAGGMGQRGYTGFGKEHAKNRAIGDLKEFWHVGRELPEGHKHFPSYGRNVWPEEIETFREHTLGLFKALDAAAAQMLHALADWFGAPKSTFSDMAQDGNSVLRLIHYPPLGNQFEPNAVRAAEHEDINLITLLCEATASGLEILTRDGEWLSVETKAGQIVVDSGDMLSRVTNDLIPSTTHRVVNPKSAFDDVTRYSMPFFVHPYPECVLGSLKEAEQMGAAPKLPAITADEFLKQRLREIGLLK